MAINDKYRFIITSPTGQFTATPDVSKLTWEWKKQSGEDFFIKELDTELRFINSSKLGIYDFDKLHAIEQGGHLCDRTEITIEKNCGNDNWILFYSGYLAMVDGRWNIEKCTVEIKPRSLNALACLVDNWENEYNLINFSSNHTIKRIEGEIEEKRCCEDRTGHPWDHVNLQTHEVSYGISTGCIEGSGWNILRNEMTFKISRELFDPMKGKWTICTSWIREKWTGGGTPSSPGWTQDGGDYVRPIPTLMNNQVKNLSDLDVNNLEDSLFYQQYEQLPDLENGLSLNEILVGLINERCTFTVVSNFFGINPDGTNPTNMAYDFATEYLQELMVFDVNQLRTTSEAATALVYEFERIWQDLKTMFNVTMRYKNGTLYIEHVSYFKDRFMLDLTKPNLLKHIKGSWEYDYDQAELPRIEKWEYGNEPDGYWRPLRVEYKGDCVRPDKQKTDTYTVVQFVVDVDGIFISNASIEKIEELEGYEEPAYPVKLLALVATKDGIINRHPITPLGGEVVTNGVMTWSNLFEHLHRWGRKKKTGLVKRYVDDPGVSTEFFSRVYNRTQKEINLPMCCSDMDQFAPEDYVRTQLGWGKVQNASYEEPAGIMKLELKQ